MTTKNPHMISALRYIDAVHDIQLDKSINPIVLLDLVENIKEKFKDAILAGYIHEYKLTTSESYREELATQEFEKEEQVKVELELESQQKKTEGILYRGKPMAEVDPAQENSISAQTDDKEEYMMYRGQKIKVKKKTSDTAAPKELLYRGKKV